MLKDIVILGTGGVAEGIIWVIEMINSIEETWNILGYIDNEKESHSMICGYPVIGNDDWLLQYDKPIYAACAIGFPGIRKKVIEKFQSKDNIIFPQLISPKAVISDRAEIGEGCVIYPGTILAPNVKVNDHVLINYNCTFGHDVEIGSYTCINPAANVSGCVSIGNACLIGSNSSIKQQLVIGDNSTVGLGAVVLSSVDSNTTVVGNPARVLKK